MSRNAWPVALDALHKVGWQFDLHRSAVKHPFVRIGQIRETCSAPHVEADARLLRINVEIVLLH